MRIAMISPEIGPFAKTGGLADVVGTLALALRRRGHEISLIMPAYRAVLKGEFALEPIDIGPGAAVLKTTLGADIPVYLIREDGYFDRDSLYATAAGDYPDNAERFTFFCRAALETLRALPVDILHCHDWQSALAIVFLKTQSDRTPELRAAKTVLTVHNLGFQGLFPESAWPLLDLERSWFSPQYLEFYGRINLLKGAILFADKITTVSPTYAEEIMTAEQGFGLEGVLRERAGDLVGILNGADYTQWDPAADPWIARPYSAADMSGKKVCKKDLQRELGLPQSAETPLFGMVSRLTPQKGFDLLEAALEPLLRGDVQLALLGSGDPLYEEYFRLLAARLPEKVAVRIGFDEPLAHRIEAGADFFLMPSLYEPCGLNQIYSLRYGTVPIVRATGGLKDTVADCDTDRGTGNGFVFGPYDAAALLDAAERALGLFEKKRAWTALMKRAMSADFSWDRSAEAYGGLYRKLAL